MNKKILSFLLISFLFLTQITYAQLEEKRTKVEITVKDGNKTITVPVRTATVSFTKGIASQDPLDKTDNRNYYLTVDFEKQDTNLLRAFASHKNGLDGQITMIDTFGKLPTRKFEFKGGKLDSLSDQLSADYTSSYYSIYCNLLIIDGVTIE
ncbi:MULTISPECIES: hypothetical protein [Flavobacterium]|uniref:Uncharacterized protein n=1 Tax=Flavobacterium endoglycinae TaxID=2816357 RepID=A0ABX7QCL1_9FLAO|nr:MULTISPECIES: hypothetical protein [Flavobacterium]QSW88787.1 hypothetical protein J0383_21425 [Flavobacterium endoglycinae]